MTLNKAILSTLSYHDIFDYPLTHKEIYKFLCGNFQFPISNFQFRNSLKDLEKTKKIFQKENFYFLPKRKEIMDLRKKRKKYSQEKIKIAKKFSKILAKIPWVKMIAITGALAMENSEKDDDIDFLIITLKNRLWLTRLLAILILEILGKRRRPNDKEIKDKICLNMFLDETVLSLPKQKHNLFTAHEIIQIKSLFNKDQTYEKFLEENKWVKQHLPNAVKSQISNLKSQNQNSNLKTKKPYFLLLTFYFLSFFEALAYQLQLKYMESKKTTEQISPSFAFFHPRNTARDVLRRYKDNLVCYNKFNV